MKKRFSGILSVALLQPVVRLKRDGNNLNKVAQYRFQCNGEDICVTALLHQQGKSLYRGHVSGFVLLSESGLGLL